MFSLRMQKNHSISVPTFVHPRNELVIWVLNSLINKLAKKADIGLPIILCIKITIHKTFLFSCTALMEYYNC